MPGILPQVLHYYVAMMSKYSNPQFHFEALTVTSSKGMAILNRKLLRFFPVSYTFCLFDKASSGSIYLVCADTISISSAKVISFQTFFPRNLKIFTVTNINNWIISLTLH